MIEQLVLIRHGETLQNVAGIVQGCQDSELSERGRLHVERLAERLRSFGADALYSSPLGRALTTAQAIARVTGLQVQTLDELREMNYGGWEGKNFREVRRDDEASYRRWIGEPDFPCPEGESHNDVLNRMKRAFEAVGGSKRPVVVAHGTAIRIGATALMNVPVSVSRQLAQDNAAFNLFVWRGERYVMKVWNDTSHCSE
ncbi:MAG TPA: histidine phosphatase family protein [Thermoanaerobaculia bacterium]|nr:histidine phosphatase family protein [Thermoanaerobaculia bacterium]